MQQSINTLRYNLKLVDQNCLENAMFPVYCEFIFCIGIRHVFVFYSNSSEI